MPTHWRNTPSRNRPAVLKITLPMDFLVECIEISMALTSALGTNGHWRLVANHLVLSASLGAVAPFEDTGWDPEGIN